MLYESYHHYFLIGLISYWYVDDNWLSCFENKTTSPTLTSLSVWDHLGGCMSFGTWEINQYSNHVVNNFSLVNKNFSGLFVTIMEPIGLRLLFLPRHNRFGVSGSMFSNCEVMFPSASGKSFMVFAISDTRVSHCNSGILSFSNDFVIQSLIYLIFLSTLLFMLCPPTGHNLKSTLTLTWSWSLISWKLNFTFLHWEMCEC